MVASGKAAAAKKTGKKGGAYHAKRGQQSQLKPGISKFSRSRSFFVLPDKRKPNKAAPKPAPKAAKAPRWYPAENQKRDRSRSKFRTWDAVNHRWVHKKQKVTLRSSITPGTVLILLAGKFRGKRVVFLKQLESGLLLVTGPFVVNGVPIRRVNQAYVIATATKVALPKLDLGKYTDTYFKKDKKKAAKDNKPKTVFAEEGKQGKRRTLPDARKADQKAIDKPLLAELKKTGFLKAYLRTGWSLQKGQYPHRMKF
jgi:large subunit ribosomal protein L6e